MFSLVGIRPVFLCIFGSVFLANVAWSTAEHSGETSFDRLGYEHPKYNLTDDQPADGSYEVRRYYANTIAYTTISSITAVQAKVAGFKRLYNYITGGNKGGVEMDMTIPVTTILRGNPCVFCKTNFTIQFYLPRLYQDKPPVPTSSDVSILKHPEYTVYVRSFGGQAYEDRARREANELFGDLTRNNVTGIVTSNMWLNEYGRRRRGRRSYNEVMLSDVKH